MLRACRAGGVHGGAIRPAAAGRRGWEGCDAQEAAAAGRDAMPRRLQQLVGGRVCPPGDRLP